MEFQYFRDPSIPPGAANTPVYRINIIFLVTTPSSLSKRQK
jgi:hypothetical protein